MGKGSVAKDRRARVEEMRRQQQAAERRRTILVMGATLLVVVFLVGLVAFAILDFRRNNPELAANEVADVGVEAAAASCEDVDSEPAEGANAHVEGRVDYPSIPPAFGEHSASPQVPAAEFYSAEDRPAVESLVHNLEHGYTVVWYAEDLPADQQDQLRRIATLARETEQTAGKFVVTAWDAGYGEFPEGKQVAITHWGAENGYRQFCGSVSGQAIQSFIEEYPTTDSPEPNAG